MVKMSERKSYFLEKEVYLTLLIGIFFLNVIQIILVLFTQLIEPTLYVLEMPLMELFFSFIIMFIIFDVYLLIILQGSVTFLIYLSNKSRKQTQFTKNLETITNLLEESNNENN